MIIAHQMLQVVVMVVKANKRVSCQEVRGELVKQSIEAHMSRLLYISSSPVDATR